MHPIIISALFAASALAAPLASDIETSLEGKQVTSEQFLLINIDKCHECKASLFGFSADCKQCTESGELDEGTVGHEEFQFNDYQRCYEVYAELEEGSTIFKKYGLRPSRNGDILTKCVDIELSLRDDLTGKPIEFKPKDDVKPNDSFDDPDLTKEEKAVKDAEDARNELYERASLYISGTCSVKGRKMRVESRIDGAHFGWSKDVDGGFYCSGKEALGLMGSAPISI